MLNLKGCSIHLDKYDKKYKPGQIIKGSIIIQFLEPTKMKGLRVEINGAAHVSWTESKRVRDTIGKKRIETVSFSAHEKYYGIKFYVVGGKQDNITISVGQHNFQFEFLIPPNIPPSYEGSNGNIRHNIHVIMDRPWKMDKSTSISYQVVSPVILLTDLTKLQPYKLELEKSFSFFSFKSGSLSFVLSIPTRTFTPGQSVPFVIDCVNASDVGIYDIVIKILKIVKFRARHPLSKTKEDQSTIYKKSVGSVQMKSSKTIREQLQVPNIALFNLDSCSIMEVYYELSVQVKITGIFSNLYGILPIKLINQTPATDTAPRMVTPLVTDPPSYSKCMATIETPLPPYSLLDLNADGI